MSNIYALEPHTNAKVILHTTSGDIEIELWGKEAPRATRNFIQLCLEGYYDNTIFHRIVPDFLVQGGDPTGTGQGGESIYEDGFPDEFHSRLRFNRRGLVGLANTGQDDNGSQFFITLDRADELTRKHTLFGRVAGDTLFNVMKMTELEVDANERPLYPPRIRSAEVVLNPFDDIIPRITAEEKKQAKLLEQKKLEEQAQKKKKKGQKKQLNLLSFGEEAAELEPPAAEKTKMKSSYDFMEHTAAADPSILEDIKSEQVSKPSEKQTEKPTEKQTEKQTEKPVKAERPVEKPVERKKKETPPPPPPSTQDTIEKLKQDIRNISKPSPTSDLPVPEKKEKKKSLVALEREKYVSQQKKKPSKKNKVDDSDVLDQLLAFRKKLSTSQPATEAESKKEQKICELHDIPNCESCFDASQFNGEDETDDGWISHRLVFDKDLKGKDLMQRKETVDDYVVIDPRDRSAKAKQEEYERKRSSRKRHREDERDERKRRY